MEEDFTSLLKGAVSAPVHWRKQPTLQKDYPYINLSLVSAPTQYLLSGEAEGQEASIQIDCWAERYSDAVVLARSVGAALSEFSGLVGATVFQGIFRDGERDLSGEITLGSGETHIHARSGDYRVRYRQA